MPGWSGTPDRGERRPRRVHDLGEGRPVLTRSCQQLDARLVDVVEHERDLERVARTQPSVERGALPREEIGVRGRAERVLRVGRPQRVHAERLVTTRSPSRRRSQTDRRGVAAYVSYTRSASSPSAPRNRAIAPSRSRLCSDGSHTANSLISSRFVPTITGTSCSGPARNRVERRLEQRRAVGRRAERLHIRAAEPAPAAASRHPALRAQDLLEGDMGEPLEIVEQRRRGRRGTGRRAHPPRPACAPGRPRRSARSPCGTVPSRQGSRAASRRCTLRPTRRRS